MDYFIEPAEMAQVSALVGEIVSKTELLLSFFSSVLKFVPLVMMPK